MAHPFISLRIHVRSVGVSFLFIEVGLRTLLRRAGTFFHGRWTLRGNVALRRPVVSLLSSAAKTRATSAARMLRIIQKSFFMLFPF